MVLAIAAALFVVVRSSGPHGPSTGLQASRTLNIQFPPTVDGSALDQSETSLLTNQLAPLQARVPALAFSTQVHYQPLARGGPGVIIAGGPLPDALRFLGNAQQAKLVSQIGAQISGPHRVHPHGWGPKPTGALGGQMWCGTEPVADSAIGLCYVVDSQNMLIITTFGDDPLTTAEQVRAQVELPAN
jgi:hypothetical protein